ncbi:FtsX-like permease family protein [Desulfobulbus alkaliphilus]|uniref:FtsX-like permease family protein n=1 Tax=Desulfobulbus alkaliphilus TaxID=869814 RepID=UPI0019649624|nr:FtsX-like permease family protein [Desulfobulbus alkaliphilus]MBM9536202.1 FtsX-like permease family protein [Desulfobulbus alkaliphilus]
MLILRLAFKDLRHDWLLSICLVLAISSIIAPLLILFGLKFGTIETLRSRLIEDPKNREIRPIVTRSYPREWFENLEESIPGVSFIVPMTRQISTTLTAINTSAGVREQLSLMATADGDPLLLENGVAVPEDGECVLTEVAARGLEASVGEIITFETRRIIQGRSESGMLTLRVAGILEERASSLKTAFVSLDVVEAVEDFKDGRAVPTYGWSGELPVAYPVFDGTLVYTPEPLTRLEEVMLINNTGFGRVDKIEGPLAGQLLGYTPHPEWSVYQVTVLSRAVTDESLQAVRNRLRGKGAVVIPWIEPLPVTLTTATKTFSAHLAALTDAATLVAPVPPAIASLEGQVILVPESAGLEPGEASLLLAVGDRTLTLPVTLIINGQGEGLVHGSASLAGTLNLLRYRDLRYDTQSASLLLSRQGYAGFRLYATTIDEVAAVQEQLEAEGITVHTARERIGEVRRLDTYMSLIFWLIAAVGVVGGISALTASLYASVERKKKELNMLRLLGLLKREIIQFPVYQGLLLSGGGLLLAGGVFLLVAGVINHLFREHLRATESLCTLSGFHFAVLVVGVFALSTLAATFAALRVTRLDPAEALRDE